MRVLVISNCNPFPPRDGLTIPIFNYIRLLNNLGCTVDLMIASNDRHNEVDSSLVDKTFYLGTHRQRIKGVINELTLSKPFAATYSFDIKDVSELNANKDYKIILCSPFTTIKIGETIKTQISNHAQLVSAISDCYTAELYNISKHAHHKNFFMSKLTYYISKFRSLLMSFIEPKILASSDFIFVQSSRDKAWLRKLTSSNFAKKVHVMTNGVDGNLFKLSLEQTNKIPNFCFVADLNVDHYLNNFLWFYRNVWLHLNQKLTLKVYTKAIKRIETLPEDVKGDDSIIIIDKFVPSLSDIYMNEDIAIAPVFKSYGFINKVGEAMAAGCLVIGDRTAFNAINGFQNGVHGIVANDADSMNKSIKFFINNPDRLHEIKVNARELAIKSLCWEGKSQMFLDILTPSKK